MDKEKEIKIERFDNPLLVAEDVDWIMKQYSGKERAVLNCGVVYDEEKKIFHMLFRGGSGSFSDIGYAQSKNGKKWRQGIKEDAPVLKHSDNNFWNGFCTKGIEDPRIVKWIDGWKYIFATACSLVGGRVGIWRTKNFLEFEWVGIPFNWEDKNASIFPESINGWTYLLHRRFPHIWLSRTKDIMLKSGWQDSQILVEKDKFYHSPNTGNLPYKIGIAGSPIRTPKGWLVITHIVHSRGENRFNRVYSLGFMSLNIDDPTKVEYIHPNPILCPEMDYEIVGSVPMVCFSNATVDPGGDSLYIYWGGADTVICGGKLLKEDLPCY